MGQSGGIRRWRKDVGGLQRVGVGGYPIALAGGTVGRRKPISCFTES